MKPRPEIRIKRMHPAGAGTLGFFSFAIHVTLLYFTADQYLWDEDPTHIADYAPSFFIGLVVTVVFAAVVLASMVRSAALVYYEVYDYTTRYAAPGQRHPFWVDALGEWTTAVSFSTAFTLLELYSWRLWWRFVGTYPAANLVTVIVLTVVVVVLDLVKFLFADRIVVVTAAAGGTGAGAAAAAATT